MPPIDPSQPIPVEIALPDGTAVSLRPVAAEDRGDLAEGFERLSATSRYRRFMTPTPRLKSRDLVYLSELDYCDHFAWGVQAKTEDGWDGAGVARYVRLSDDPASADAAYTVLDEYQGRGIGQVLFRALAIAGRANHVQRFHFDVLADNAPMLRMLQKFDVTMKPAPDGLIRGTLELEPFVDEMDGWPPGAALIRLAAEARRTAGHGAGELHRFQSR